MSIALQAVVVSAPVLQSAFGTTALEPADWLQCTAVASSVVWVRELSKVVARELADDSTTSIMDR